MKYILFKNGHCIYDSIIMTAENDIKTEKIDSSLGSEPEHYGFGSPRVHLATEGLVFDNLKLLKHYFQGAVNFTEPPSNSDESEFRRNLRYFYRNMLSLRSIKYAMKMEGAYNLDLYNHECGYESDTYCYQNYLLYKQIIGE